MTTDPTTPVYDVYMHRLVNGQQIGRTIRVSAADPTKAAEIAKRVAKQPFLVLDRVLEVDPAMYGNPNGPTIYRG